MAARPIILAQLFTTAVGSFNRFCPPKHLNVSGPFRHMLQPFISAQFSSLFAIRLGLPPILAGLWESVLRAVPKKKTSHRKKRQRFMAGKGLKDVTALNKCSACGNVKRAHLLCPFCVGEIRAMWKKEKTPLKHQDNTEP